MDVFIDTMFTPVEYAILMVSSVVIFLISYIVGIKKTNTVAESEPQPVCRNKSTHEVTAITKKKSKALLQVVEYIVSIR